MSMWNWVNPADASQPTPSRALTRGKRLALQNELAGAIQHARELDSTLKTAHESKDPRHILDVVSEVKHARDVVNDLHRVLEADAERQEREREAREAQTDALRAVHDEIKRANDLATATTATGVFQVKKWITDVASAQIGDPTAKTVETHRRDEGEWEKQVLDRADRQCEAVEAGNRCPNTQNLKAVGYGSKRRVEDGAALCPKHVVSHG